MKTFMLTVTFALLAIGSVVAVEKGKLPAGSKVFIQPMEGFDTYVVAAIHKKKVPVTVVTNREVADFELGGGSDSERSGWARTIFLGQSGSNEQASVKLVNLKSSEVVFAYAVNKRNSVRGKQSAAEACAKHMKEAFEKAK